MIRSYIQDTGVQWPILIDQERTLYQAYQMDRARRRDVFGPASVGIYFKLFAKGRRLRKPGSDIYQRGGDVLIDPAGTVRLHYIGQDPSDRPAVEAILAAHDQAPMR